jgi:hypothetical protein
MNLGRTIRGPFAHGLLAGVIAMACAWSAPAGAQTPGAAAAGIPPLLDVALESAGPAFSPAAVRQVGISGQWPTDCPPVVAGVSLEGAELTVHARFPVTGCHADRPTAYHLRIGPSAIAGLPQLPAQVYRTRVYLAAAQGTPELSWFGLLDATSVPAAPRPGSGFWWSQPSAATGAALAGSGVALEFQDHRLAAGFLGFDDDGRATWYFGSARLEGRVAHVPLVALNSGDAPFGATGGRPLAEPGPRMEIEFQSPTRALAWLVRDRGNGTLDVRALSISRSLFAAEPAGTAWSGRWVLTRNGDDTARVFDLGDLNRDGADRFQLADAAGGALLDCRIDGVLAGGAPDFCTLDYDFGTRVNFNQIGVDQLRGVDAGGTVMQLLRIPD